MRVTGLFGATSCNLFSRWGKDSAGHDQAKRSNDSDVSKRAWKSPRVEGQRSNTGLSSDMLQGILVSSVIQIAWVGLWWETLSEEVFCCPEIVQRCVGGYKLSTSVCNLERRVGCTLENAAVWIHICWRKDGLAGGGWCATDNCGWCGMCTRAYAELLRLLHCGTNMDISFTRDVKKWKYGRHLYKVLEEGKRERRPRLAWSLGSWIGPLTASRSCVARRYGVGPLSLSTCIAVTWWPCTLLAGTTERLTSHLWLSGISCTCKCRIGRMDTSHAVRCLHRQGRYFNTFWTPLWMKNGQWCLL